MLDQFLFRVCEKVQMHIDNWVFAQQPFWEFKAAPGLPVPFYWLIVTSQEVSIGFIFQCIFFQNGGCAKTQFFWLIDRLNLSVNFNRYDIPKAHWAGLMQKQSVILVFQHYWMINLKQIKYIFARFHIFFRFPN